MGHCISGIQHTTGSTSTSAIPSGYAKPRSTDGRRPSFLTGKKPRKASVKPNNSWKQRYQQLHEEDFKNRYPVAYRDGHYCQPKYPDVKKANGLQNAIENFINWSGYRATRVNNIARLPDKEIKTASGLTFTEKRFSRATRKGQADISSTIKGRSYMFEVKIGSDRPSEHQLKEQDKERKAGGGYEFVKTIEEFLELFDKIIDNN